MFNNKKSLIMADEVFVYMGGDMVVPQDVVRVDVHTSVTTIIPERAFQSHQKLEEIELCEGLLEIGNDAFYNCKSLKHINIPSTVTTIGEFAFCHNTSLATLSLPDPIESIGGKGTFCNTQIPTVRIPPLVKSLGLFLILHRMDMDKF